MSEPEVNPKVVAVCVALGIAGILTLCGIFGGFYVVSPGERAVVVTLGRASEVASGEGFWLKTPFVSSVVRVKTKQETQGFDAEAFSSDLQHLRISVQVLYRIPEAQAVNMVRNYAGDPFDALIVPRVQEALKEVTALETAEKIAKTREIVKQKTLALSREKIGDLLFLEDVVLVNIKLSQDLEHAIEAKMVQEQAAAKARFTQMQAEVDARTAAIRAEGEANAIRIRGEAIKQNPRLIELQIVERWNGVSPLVVGSDSANILLPLKTEK